MTTDWPTIISTLAVALIGATPPTLAAWWAKNRVEHKVDRLHVEVNHKLEKYIAITASEGRLQGAEDERERVRDEEDTQM